MKKILAMLLSLGMMATLTSCTYMYKYDDALREELAGKTYIWENDGFGGAFAITLDKDGSFQYLEGPFSSYLGLGNWVAENGTVTLTETGGYAKTFRFAAEDGALVFRAEGSDEFLHAEVEDGDRFLPGE